MKNMKINWEEKRKLKFERKCIGNHTRETKSNKKKPTNSLLTNARHACANAIFLFRKNEHL